MRLDITIDGVHGSIEILAPAPSCRFKLDGEERAADVDSPEPGVYSVLMDGRSYEARIEENPRGMAVVIDGHRFEIAVRDPRRLAHGDGARGAAAVETLIAPMPGKVVRVLVAPGDVVKADQGIVVVEAMKMQNELKASHAGRVASLPAKEGATVIAGETLATISAVEG